MALGAYPHRLAGGTLTVSYGASFHAHVPLRLIHEVAARRAVLDQSRTAAIRNGGILLPAMGGLTALDVVGAVLLLYAAAAAFATADRVRPHTLGHGRIVLRACVPPRVGSPTSPARAQY